MIRRVLQALGRRRGEPAERPPRPNELRRDVARAERLRREALRTRATASPQRVLTEERQERQERREPAAARAGRPDGEPSLVAALRSRSGLRQAWLVTEILGPPRALRGPHASSPDA